jgi:hypothetical protein
VQWQDSQIIVRETRVRFPVRVKKFLRGDPGSIPAAGKKKRKFRKDQGVRVLKRLPFGRQNRFLHV